MAIFSAMSSRASLSCRRIVTSAVLLLCVAALAGNVVQAAGVNFDKLTIDPETMDDWRGFQEPQEMQVYDPVKQRERELQQLLDGLSGEQLSTAEKHAILHRWELADEDTRLLIRTSVELIHTEPALRCSACEATLGEVQMSMILELKQMSKLSPHHSDWATLWTDMGVEDKFDMVRIHFQRTDICDERLYNYGLHRKVNMYIPARIGDHAVPDVDASPAVRTALNNHCRYLEYAFKDEVVRVLGNDTERVYTLIKAKDENQGGRVNLEERLSALWHSTRKKVCDKLTKANGACLRQAHPLFKP
mmetsp:Transcript_33526/g.40519  ORF Transcript_33526/g.40519 Transcript_33526/m.40519 type:complete len:304 (-) Transcript_33526:226-1137(-)|eukprot:CAMPEP_0197863450 /NCGR_PEP_ID=MMETSP1438-20131217/40909_1 /TAXON_ID=1461541 /ORGANISM="Pterosperma sp., Strain CCMP1384" /LENGTH=303 /DNA_ID=CAMNT_0043481343 /DNA_START=345 /DNA_END=1256 /DNA_ORIENTATION=-